MKNKENKKNKNKKKIGEHKTKWKNFKHIEIYISCIRITQHWERWISAAEIIWFSAQIRRQMHVYVDAHAHPWNKKIRAHRNKQTNTHTRAVMNYNHKFYRLTMRVLRDENCNHFFRRRCCCCCCWLHYFEYDVYVFSMYCIRCCSAQTYHCLQLHGFFFSARSVKFLSHDCYQTENDTKK